MAQLENDGRFAEASRVFAFSLPNASYTQKMQFADRMYLRRAYRQALTWYDECIGTPVKEEYYYLTGGQEGKSPMQREAEKHFLHKEYAKAKELYRRLVQETDDGYFMFMLGECYLYEAANEYAFEHAVYWYRYALEKGDTHAYYALGMAYQIGRGVERDTKRAEELYEEGTKYAIDRDNCYCKLGNFRYARGEYEKAKEYYDKAAVLNNARSLLNLAIGYLNRDIRDLSREQAKCLLAKAAALGNARACALYRNLEKENGK